MPRSVGELGPVHEAARLRVGRVGDLDVDGDRTPGLRLQDHRGAVVVAAADERDHQRSRDKRWLQRVAS